MYENFMIVDVIWQGRVCFKVFSYLVTGSSESLRELPSALCMRVLLTIMSLSKENKSCTRVDNREFRMCESFMIVDES